MSDESDEVRRLTQAVLQLVLVGKRLTEAAWILVLCALTMVVRGCA